MTHGRPVRETVGFFLEVIGTCCYMCTASMIKEDRSTLSNHYFLKVDPH